uniref:Protein kinase domain-containing protein n=1 Tax=Entomoneis paludosa TaxID=265537 RepID=A0A7S2YHN3_9STRA
MNSFEYKQLAHLVKEISMPAGATLYQKDQPFPGACYLIRTGTVSFRDGTDGYHEKGKKEGFGFDTLLMDAPAETAIAKEDCVLGMLSRRTIQEVIQHMSRLNTKPAKRILYPLDKLQRHRLLGEGSFGKVWLVHPLEHNLRSISNNSMLVEPFALKVQKKRALLDEKQVPAVTREIAVMAELNHPFICKLVNVYMDERNVFMLMNIIRGGELYSAMKKMGIRGMPEKDSKFYAAGILEGLCYMHNRDIAYRDLKAENVLLDKDGYPVIVDLGFAKRVSEKTFTTCGTPLYVAPEVILGRGHDTSCDYWSWGILIYEMLSGATPFERYAADHSLLFKTICKGHFKMSRKIPENSDVADLIRQTLTVDPSERLGSFAGGTMDVKQHPWLMDVDFYQLSQKKYRAPWLPLIRDALDAGGKRGGTRTLGEDFDDDDDKKNPHARVTAKEQEKFLGIKQVMRSIHGEGIDPEDQSTPFYSTRNIDGRQSLMDLS